jgi:dephospho-CoA kinase
MCGLDYSAGIGHTWYMKVIGLTGNIGSGKSSVARILEQLGAACIDADKVGHEIYNPGTPGWQEVVETFGRDILTPEGIIDRKKLSQKVFSTPQGAAALNKIAHPKIRRAVEDRLNSYRTQGKGVAVVEATLLVEAGWMDMVDELWLVTAPKELTLKRLEGRGLPESEALARMAAQTPPEKLASYARAVIKNDGNMDRLREQVEKLWNGLHNNR